MNAKKSNLLVMESSLNILCINVTLFVPFVLFPSFSLFRDCVCLGTHTCGLSQSISTDVMLFDPGVGLGSCSGLLKGLIGIGRKIFDRFVKIWTIFFAIITSAISTRARNTNANEIIRYTSKEFNPLSVGLSDCKNDMPCVIPILPSYEKYIKRKMK